MDIEYVDDAQIVELLPAFAIGVLITVTIFVSVALVQPAFIAVNVNVIVPAVTSAALGV